MTFLDRMAYEMGQAWVYKPLLNSWVLEKKSFIFAVPRTYKVDLNARSLYRVCKHYGEEISERMIIVSHDINLPLGTFGHTFGSDIELNEGLLACAEVRGTNKFRRFSIGVAAPPDDMFTPTILNYLTNKDDKQHARQYEHNKFPVKEQKLLDEALYGNIPHSLKVLFHGVLLDPNKKMEISEDDIATATTILKIAGIPMPYHESNK